MSIQTNGDDERTQINNLCEILGIDARLSNEMTNAAYTMMVERILIALLYNPFGRSLAQVKAIRRLYPDPIEDAEREAVLKQMRGCSQADVRLFGRNHERWRNPQGHQAMTLREKIGMAMREAMNEFNCGGYMVPWEDDDYRKAWLVCADAALKIIAAEDKK